MLSAIWQIPQSAATLAVLLSMSVMPAASAGDGSAAQETTLHAAQGKIAGQRKTSVTIARETTYVTAPLRPGRVP